MLQEGEVGAGDDIVKIADGPEKITVADIDALLYLPGHSSEQLQRALQIPALSKGWQSSFQAMLEQDLTSKTAAGNLGLATEEQASAWPGFRQMRVAKLLIRKAIASLPSVCHQSMGSLFLFARHVNLWSCGCSSIWANRRPSQLFAV